MGTIGSTVAKGLGGGGAKNTFLVLTRLSNVN